MPVIAYFFGIYVRMYFDDHAPAHFHFEYQGQVALIEIARGEDSVRCGTYQRALRQPRTLADEDFTRAIECATTVWREGKPFFASIEGPGIDSYVATGILGMRSRGGHCRFGYDSSPCCCRLEPDYGRKSFSVFPTMRFSISAKCLSKLKTA